MRKIFTLITLRYKYAISSLKSPLFTLMVLELLAVPTFLVSTLITFLLVKYRPGFISKTEEKDLKLVRQRCIWISFSILGFIVAPFLGEFIMGLIVFISLAITYGNWGGHLLTKIHAKTNEVRNIEEPEKA